MSSIPSIAANLSFRAAQDGVQVGLSGVTRVSPALVREEVDPRNIIDPYQSQRTVGTNRATLRTADEFTGITLTIVA